jgi:ribose 5-phosphate isomerase A
VADLEEEKRLAAVAGADLVESGMRIGLGTGSTVAYLLPELGRRQLDLVCVATSPATELAAKAVGLRIEPFEQIGRLDLAIDGADQVDPDHWLIKGGGGAHTREKIVAAAADRFAVIVSSNKQVDRLHTPVPVELSAFGLAALLARVPEIVLRAGAANTPDGGVLGDFMGVMDDREALARRLDSLPGVVAHGLFPSDMVSVVLVGHAG